MILQSKGFCLQSNRSSGRKVKKAGHMACPCITGKGIIFEIDY